MPIKSEYKTALSLHVLAFGSAAQVNLLPFGIGGSTYLSRKSELSLSYHFNNQKIQQEQTFFKVDGKEWMQLVKLGFQYKIATHYRTDIFLTSNVGAMIKYQNLITEDLDKNLKTKVISTHAASLAGLGLSAKFKLEDNFGFKCELGFMTKLGDPNEILLLNTFPIASIALYHNFPL